MVTVPAGGGTQLIENVPLVRLSASEQRIAVVSVTALRSANVNPIIWAY